MAISTPYADALKNRLNGAPAKQNYKAALRGEMTDTGTGAKNAPVTVSYNGAPAKQNYKTVETAKADTPYSAALADLSAGRGSERRGGGGSFGMSPALDEFRGMNAATVKTDIGMTDEQKKNEKNRLLENMNSLTSSINTLMTAQSRGVNVSDALSARRAELDAAQKEYDRIARSGLHSRANELQWQIDDARKTVDGIKSRLPSTDAQWRSAASDIKSGNGGAFSAAGSELTRAQNELREAKEDKKLLDYVNKYDAKTSKTRKDTFGGQFGANYTLGRLTQDSSLAWDKYLSEPDERNRVRAEVISRLVDQMRENNVEALDDENVKLPWLSKDLANYLPQLIDQLEYEAAGAVAGGLGGSVIPGVGTAAGMKAGAIAGSGLYSYKTMRGAAFRELKELGVPEDRARKAASDEAVISSMIEMADTGLDLATLGTGKILGAFGKKGIKQVAGKAVSEWAGNTAFRKFLVGLGKYGINILGETAEEALQEAVSIANQRRARTGRWDLLQGSADVLKNAVTGEDPESLQRIAGAGKGGARIAAMLGGGTMLTTGLGENVMNGGRNITAGNGQIEGENGQIKAGNGQIENENGQIENENGQIAASMQETAGNKKTATIINHLRANAAELKKMAPVVTISGNELPKAEKATDRAMAFLKSIGNKVFRPGLGDVLFSYSKIKTSLVGHGASQAKIETIAAVPAVIQQGKELSHIENYENRGYDTYLFGAPVTYRGEPVLIGVVVAKDQQSGRYYVHEVTDDKGNIIMKSEGPESNADRPLAVAGAPVILSDPSSDTIPQQNQTVNTSEDAAGGQNTEAVFST
ncbi:MAG: hypothetical protein ILP09_00470 [Oscillospiraceae bacterium]|nr:hypothetical protein [Oscillospiraceae bacterium]